MTDADHRLSFFAPIIDEVERILAVHAVYRSVRDIVLPDKPAGAGATEAGATEAGAPPPPR